MIPRKNDLLTLTVESISDLGFGIGKIDGFTVFVSGAVTGDEVRARVIKAAKTYAVAKTEELLRPSPLREERCTLPCRACAYRGIRYEEEVRIKRENVRASFAKAGLSDVDVLPPLTAATCRYRNKAEYPVTREGGKVKIGFYAPKTHAVKEAAACPLAPAVFEEILEVVRTYLEDCRVSTYDEETGAGLLRHIYLRRGEVSHEILLTFVVNGKGLPQEEMLCERLLGRFPDVVGILVNENVEKTNVILGKNYRTLAGRPYLYDTLAGVKLKLAAPAFYQVNHAAAEILYAKAKEFAALKEGDVLLDLFCGAGSIGLSMADACAEVVGVEIIPEAVENAKENARAAGAANAHFYVGDATETEKLLARAEAERGEKIRPTVVVLDPPRKGCDEKLLTFVSSLSPARIVYVSCAPDTLARDVKFLSSLGYETKEVQPVDLFPGTGHCECVLKLEKSTESGVC